MTPRFRRWAPILTALLVGMLLGGWAVERVGAGNELYSYLDLFNDALAKVEGAYVEEVDPKDLMYGAIRGMLASLDPYSMFLDEEAFRDFQVTTEGEFGGLGIQITVRDGVLTVVSPIEGTPAYDLGIQAGDRIVAIEGEPTRGITVGPGHRAASRGARHEGQHHHPARRRRRLPRVHRDARHHQDRQRAVRLHARRGRRAT